MTPMRKIVAVVVATLTVAGCASVVAETDYGHVALDLIKQDFRSKGPATLERVTAQDDAQQLCSTFPKERSSEVNARIEAAQLKTVKLPADGKYLGKWQEGEKVAQNGRGMQSSDALGAPNGGNCYACHQMERTEVSYGTLGPSLTSYGKDRKFGADEIKQAYTKIYNSQAVLACSNMPRFGANKFLTEKQIKDLVAFLFDPASPVNK